MRYYEYIRQFNYLTKEYAVRKAITCLAGVVVMFTVGCGGSKSMFPGDKLHLEAAIESVSKRTAFDIDCKEVDAILLGDITRLGQQMTTMSIGVTGCGKKATYYTECVSNWGKITCTPRLNSVQTQETRN